MIEGLFADLDIDIDSIPEDPFTVAPGTYLCEITGAETKASKDGEKNNFRLRYTVLDGDYEDTAIFEYFQKPFPGQEAEISPEMRKSLSKLRQRLTNIGIPTNQHKTVTTADLVGRRVYVDVVVNEGTGAHEGRRFQNVQGVHPVPEGLTSGSDSMF